MRHSTFTCQSYEQYSTQVLGPEQDLSLPTPVKEDQDFGSVMDRVYLPSAHSSPAIPHDDYHDGHGTSVIDYGFEDVLWGPTSLKPWWESLNITMRSTVSSTTPYDPVANMSLSPQEAVDLLKDLHKLNATVVEQTESIFGENKPELNELVFKWLFELVNKTKVDNNTTFITHATETISTISIYDLTSKFTEGDPFWHEKDEAANSNQPENVHREGNNYWNPTVESFPSEHIHGVPPDYNPKDPLGFNRKIPPQGYQGGAPEWYQGPSPQETDLSFLFPPAQQTPSEKLQERISPLQSTGFQGNLPTHQKDQHEASSSSQGVSGQNPGIQESTLRYTTQELPGGLKGVSPNLSQGRQFETPTTALAPTPLPPAARQVDYLDIMQQAELGDMFPQYGHGRPSMADSNIGDLLLGITTPTTTTIHPMVRALKQQMVTSRSGYFSIFFTKLLELLAVMEKAHAARLFVATDLVFNDLERDGTIRDFGIPFLPVTMKAMKLLSGTEPEIVQNQAAIGFQMMNQRRIVLDTETNTIIDSLDSLYLMHEGDALLLTLLDVDEYPANNYTSRKVARRVVNAVLAPYHRLAGTEWRRTLLDKINEAIAKKFPYRKSEGQGTKRYHSKEDDKKKYSLKIHGRLTSLKPISNDLNKQAKNTIEEHLNKRHREAFRLVQDKRKTKKEAKIHRKHTINERFGHGYEQLFRNRTVIANSGNKNREHLKRTTDDLKKRFQVVNMFDPFRNKEWNIEDAATNTKGTDLMDLTNHANVTIQNVPPEKSKYLDQMPNKSNTKSRIVNNKIISDKIKHFKSNDEENYLKFRLRDTIRHGDTRFVERRNFKARNRKKLYEMSSASAEDAILKSQIYKEFYNKFGHSDR